MKTTIFSIDRAFLKSIDELAETVAEHLQTGEIVQVLDSAWPSEHRLRYTVQRHGEADYVFDGNGRALGVFADLGALIAHAETITA